MKDTLSTLVHEQVHLQDFVNGTAPKKAYHGKSWVTLMNAVDLTPVIMDAKGNPTGKETGPNSTHEIVTGGKFDVACDNLLKTGFALNWNCLPEPEKVPKEKKKKAGGKFKYEADCGSAFWGKPGIKATCQCCDDPFEQIDKEDGEDE
jgi:hypothetical protein